MKALRYGIIGCGSNGRGHIGALRHVEGVEIAALADPHMDNLEKGRSMVDGNPFATDDHRELLAHGDLDAVVVSTPNITHADIIVDALQAGKHVLGEKPMATTMRDCARIRKAAGESGRIYQIGFELRFNGEVQRMKEWLTANKIGVVRQMWFCEFRGPWMRKVNEWITQKEKSGGTLLEKDCHHFDLFNHFSGSRPLRVAAFGGVDRVYGKEHFGGVEPDVLDNAQVLVEYEDGAVACLMLNMFSHRTDRSGEMGVIGRTGHMLWKSQRQEVFCRLGDAQDGVFFRNEIPPEVRATSHGGMIYYEHLAFRDGIRTGKPVGPGADEGWWSTMLGLAAEKAVEERCVISLPDFLKDNSLDT